MEGASSRVDAQVQVQKQVQVLLPIVKTISFEHHLRLIRRDGNFVQWMWIPF